MNPEEKNWICQHCRKPCDGGHDVCWNCGSHRDGSPADPDFVRYDARLPEPAWSNPSNYRMGRFLAGLVTVVGWLAIIGGVVLLALNPTGPGAGGTFISILSFGIFSLLLATVGGAVFDIADGRAPER